ncbi:MAG: transposase [Anaerolineales bacterium]|nr:transposase [Anaerolineales bacterium]
MSKHILIFESKTNDTDVLVSQIEANGDYIVSRVQTMREAGALLTQQKQDLALLPITRNDSLVYTLRVLQPGLPMFLVRNETDEFIPPRQEQAVNGVIDREAIPHAAAKLIDGSWNERDLHYRPRHHLPKLEAFDESRLAAILRNALMDDYLHLIIVQYKVQLYHEQTAVGEERLPEILARLQEIINPYTLGAQIGFLNRTNGPENLFLFTKQIAQNVFVTLGAELNVSIARLQRLTQNITKQMLNSSLPVKHIPLVPEGKNSYALVWQSQTAIAAGIFPVIRNILHQIAKVYHCTITFLDIEPNYVHMVVTVPAERSSGWAARIFKHHSGKLLSKALGITANYWADGFLAKETDHQLSSAELKLYLKERERVAQSSA